MISFAARWILILWVCYKISLESGILISMSLAMAFVFLEIAFLWLMLITSAFRDLVGVTIVVAKKNKGDSND